MKILIGTPTYNHQVTTPFVSSLLALVERLRGKGVQVGWLPVQGTLIHVARNHLATLALHDTSTTHLLMVDSDMGFRPEAIERMLAFDEPFVASACPARLIDMSSVFEAARAGQTLAASAAAGLKYPVHLTEQPRFRGGFGTAEKIGAGILLLKREVLEKVRDAYPAIYVNQRSSVYDQWGHKRVLQCFDPLYDDTGILLSEDYSFCRRWSALGGEIWAMLDEVIMHVGTYAYQGARGTGD